MGPRLNTVDDTLQILLAQYERARVPVPVSFRRLSPAPSPRTSARLTHDIHPYPARLYVSIPAFFLSSTFLSRPGDLVADPFCGSGTVLLESVVRGRNAIGADSNPLARLISRAKTTAIRPDRLHSATQRLFRRVSDSGTGTFPDVVNIDYWFYPHVKRDILRLLSAIWATRDDTIRTFFLVTLSSCVKELSLADPRLSVPVKLRRDQYPPGHWLQESTETRLRRLRRISVQTAFRERLAINTARVSTLHGLSGLGTCYDIDNDARKMISREDDSVALVITSPPYLGAQKYVRATSLNLTWLGYCKSDGLRALEQQCIGREHYAKVEWSAPKQVSLPAARDLINRVREVNPLRAHIAATYLEEMDAALHELYRIVKPGGHVVLVAGGSTLVGNPFPTPDYLVSFCESAGFRLRLRLVDPIRSRSLMTKRHKTAGLIDSETILLFRKPE